MVLEGKYFPIEQSITTILVLTKNAHICPPIQHVLLHMCHFSACDNENVKIRRY